MTKNKRGRPKIYKDPVDVNVRIERELLILLRQQFPNESTSRAISLYLESTIGRVVEASQDSGS